AHAAQLCPDHHKKTGKAGRKAATGPLPSFYGTVQAYQSQDPGNLQYRHRLFPTEETLGKAVRGTAHPGRTDRQKLFGRSKGPGGQAEKRSGPSGKAAPFGPEEKTQGACDPFDGPAERTFSQRIPTGEATEFFRTVPRVW